MIIADVKQLLNYDPETGGLTWVYRPMSSCHWNTRYAGKSAGTVRKNGYVIISLNGKKYYAHRVAWAIAYGAWPDNQIDHINGLRTDNRITNLRVVTPSGNNRNAAVRSDNHSGYVGVRWCEPDKKWKAQITVDRKQYHLGLFDNLDDAVAARMQASKIHGFHSGHGKKLEVVVE